MFPTERIQRCTGADPLSRAYLPLVKQDIVDTLEVWTVADTRSLTEVEIESIPIQKLTFQEIKRANEVDAELQELAPIIAQGWSEKWVEVPSQLQVCFPFREELAIQNGVVFKDERFVVFSSLRQCMMDKVHASHLGIQGCLKRAKEAFYWPGTEFFSRCSICNSYKPEQQMEPLKCH